MADPPPPPEDPAATLLSPTQAESLLSFFTSFLTLSIHSLLYHRHLYPPTSFLTARAYNLPVQQSRHPGVCRWVKEAVAAVAAQVRRANVARIVFVVHGAADSFSVLEKWIFDVSSFPEWQQDGNGAGGGSDFGQGDLEEEEEEDTAGGLMGDDEVVEMEGEVEDTDEEEEVENPDDDDDDDEREEEKEDINWADVHESLRSALRKLSHVAEKMPPLPKGCTFTLAVELRDDAPAPVSHPLPWIASSSIMQRHKRKRIRERFERKILANSTDTMAPIRAVQAGPLFFECWAERAKPKSGEYKKPDRPAMRPNEMATETGGDYSKSTKKVGFDLSESTSSSTSSSRTVKPRS